MNIYKEMFIRNCTSYVLSRLHKEIGLVDENVTRILIK